MSLRGCYCLFHLLLSDRAELPFVDLSDYVRSSMLPFADIDWYLLHPEAPATLDGSWGGLQLDRGRYWLTQTVVDVKVNIR